MIKYTPGPWMDRKRTDGLLLVGSPTRIVCDVAHHGGGEDAANARIIAAAPDLLATCEEARRALTNDWHNKPRIGAEEMCAQIDAVIAKARGET